MLKHVGFIFRHFIGERLMSLHLDLTGLTFDGYQFQKPLGNGGTAVVWLAFKPLGVGPPISVAVKVFAEILENFGAQTAASDHRYEGQMMSSAQGNWSLAPLLRPANLGFFEVFTDCDGKVSSTSQYGFVKARAYYIEYPLADGSLETAFSSDYKCGENIELVLQDMVQAALALELIHKSDFVHGDMKLENLLKFSDERRRDVRLGDPHSSGGTPPHMAPELFLGSGATPSSDVYALGVTIYRAATGRYPFQLPTGTAASLSEWRKVHLTPTRPIMSSITPLVPYELNKLILPMLDVDPAKRPSSEQTRVGLEEILTEPRNVKIRIPATLNRVTSHRSIMHGTRFYDPNFLIKDLGLTACFFFIRWKAAFDENAQSLFRTILERVGRNVRFLQVSGETDFVSRVFVHEREIPELTDKIMKLTNELNSVQVFVAEQVDPVVRTARYEPHSDQQIREILWDIEMVQDERMSVAARELAADRLVTQGILLPGAAVLQSDTSEVAYSSFYLNGKARRMGNNGNRQPSEPYSAMLNGFREDSSFRDWGVVLYEKSPHKVSSDLEWPDDLLVEFTMPSPTDLPQMLRFLQGVRGRFPDQTLRASHEYLVDSNDLETGRCPNDVMRR